MLILSKFSTVGDTLAFKDYAATGTILRFSDQLVLTSNPGFQVGDTIIVPVGFEANNGFGTRGHYGVGGTWPALVFADATARDADTGQATNTYCWIESTGGVSQWDGDSWNAVDVANYYHCQAVPLALVAEILAIDGTTLTLDQEAEVDSIAATVYYDNTEVFNTAAELGASAPTANTLIIPAGGLFAVSDQLLINQHNGWIVRGQDEDTTTVFSPDGTKSASLRVHGSNGVLLRDFHLKGNVGENGFGLNVTETAVTQGEAWPLGIHFFGCDGGAGHRLKVTDVFYQALGTSFCANVWFYNCNVVQTEVLRQYLGWHTQQADSAGGGFVDCDFTSAFLMAGLEAFKCEGTTFLRCSGTNVVMALNDSGGYLIDELNLTISANSYSADGGFSLDTPILNINSNIGASGRLLLGGTIRNHTITQAGFVSGSSVLKGIVVNDDCPNVTIEGGYPDAERGYISHPNGNLGTGIGITSTAENTLIDGVRVVGTNANATWGNIAANQASSTVRDCVADLITGNATESNNQTNAEYEA